jgi:NADH-quinone oxidoreductase subunit D
LVFALAAERLQGTEVPERAKYIRVLLAELTRIQSHLLWFGVAGLAMGFDTVFKVALTYREEILRLFAELTGGRVYPAGYIRPGGVRWDLPQNFLERAEQVLRRTEYYISELNDLFFENPSFVARTKGLAVLSPEEGIRLGASGPALRASHIPYDVRVDDPHLVYDRLKFRVITRGEGDALARFLVGRDEVLESVKICIQAIRDMPEGEHAVKVGPFTKVKEGEAYAHIEAARGDAGCYIVGTGKRTPYRVKFRGPSFTLLIPVLEHLLRGVEIADVPVVYWSLNHCPADMDR